MTELTKLLDESTAPDSPNFVTPSIVGTVVGLGGKVLWEHASGVGHHEDEAATINTVFWLASQSKLMCTVASLQVVEKGLIRLDDDVAPYLPDLAALEVLDGGEDANGVPTTKPRQNKITLRGVGYDSMPFNVAKWAQMKGIEHTTLDSTQGSMKACPLAFEPGTDWSYGAGIDWAGELVARLNKTTLGESYNTNIWGPLGMKNTTFHPSQFESSIVMPCLRGDDGKVVATPLPVPIKPVKETAGHGVWGTAKDYAKLLGALLTGGGPLLSQKSVDEIFTFQTPDTKAITEMVHGPFKPALGPSIPLDQEVHHGLAGLISLADYPGRRKKGTLQWSGMPNLIWWIDRKAGIAATAFQQLMPVGDPEAARFNIKFEEAVYKAFGKN
ncbi:beta-lactamase/transpeptidase-like protein [Ilyonectria destructans]|nr:beta-lactamase/transpeptidase-like protein [Ilyonectria destructans]